MIWVVLAAIAWWAGPSEGDMRGMALMLAVYAWYLEVRLDRKERESEREDVWRDYGSR